MVSSWDGVFLLLDRLSREDLRFLLLSEAAPSGSGKRQYRQVLHRLASPSVTHESWGPRVGVLEVVKGPRTVAVHGHRGLLHLYRGGKLDNHYLRRSGKLETAP